MLFVVRITVTKTKQSSLLKLVFRKWFQVLLSVQDGVVTCCFSQHLSFDEVSGTVSLLLA